MTTKEMLKKSVDMHSYRSSIITIFVIMIFFYAIIAMLAISVELTDATVFYSVLYFFLMVPFIAYDIIKIYLLMKSPDSYREYIATPVEMLPAFKKKMAFILDVENSTDTSLTVTTGRIFSMSALSRTYYGDYYKQKVRILYDASEERVAVIELISQIPEQKDLFI